MFLNLLIIVLCPNKSSMLHNVTCVLEKNVYSAFVGLNVLYMSLNSLLSIALFKSSVLLLSLSLDDIYSLLKVGC